MYFYHFDLGMGIPGEGLGGGGGGGGHLHGIWRHRLRRLYGFCTSKGFTTIEDWYVIVEEGRAIKQEM
jgi:hypothetical protein